jgi:hypothetical protein
VAALDAALEARTGTFPDQSGKPQDVTLRIANAPFGQRGLAIEPAYLDALGSRFGAGLRLVDYARAAEAARAEINGWVADETEHRIEDLLAPGAVDDMTRLVLVNAIYLKAAWQQPFIEGATAPSVTRRDGSTVEVPMMRRPAASATERRRVPGGGAAVRRDRWRCWSSRPTTSRRSRARSMTRRRRDRGGLGPRGRLACPGSLPSRGSSWLRSPGPACRPRSRTAPTHGHHRGGAARHRRRRPPGEHRRRRAGHRGRGGDRGDDAGDLDAGRLVRLTVDRPFLFALRDLETGAVVFLGRIAQRRGRRLGRAVGFADPAASPARPPLTADDAQAPARPTATVPSATRAARTRPRPSQPQRITAS